MQSILLVVLVLLAFAAADKEAEAAEALPPQALPGCTDHCGNLTIPYPFGIEKDCYMSEDFSVRCNTSAEPPIATLGDGNIVITNISLAEGEMQIPQFVASDCYNSQGERSNFLTDLWVRPFTVSQTRNKFIAVGCDTYAIFRGYRADEEWLMSGCMSICDNRESVEQSCSGVGCCKTDIPIGLFNYTVRLDSYYNHTYVLDFNPCSYAFIVEEGNFTFSPNTSFQDLSNIEKLPMILNWEIGEVSCDEAQKKDDYACKANSTCVDRTISNDRSGYICQCLEGYQGNPYLPDGCQDIDECKVSNTCTNGKCQNSPGSYSCSPCDRGYISNGTNHQSCIQEIRKKQSKTTLLLIVSLSVTGGFLVLFVGISWICCAMKNKKLKKLKEKYFQENGGLLLLQQLANHGGSVETTKIFTEEELENATNNYHESGVLGEGGYGTVYKGVLKDNKVVAIKKSKGGTSTQSEQFVNEVIVLSQINHRNVVKLLGCCLETAVPLLVYEFVNHGTLYEHIHKRRSSLSFELRMKIAVETAGALAYLHSSTSMPIIHRDVKAANILLDDNYTAKVSDFGASRLVPLGQTEIQTLVLGTFGYLEPPCLARRHHGLCQPPTSTIMLTLCAVLFLPNAANREISPPGFSRPVLTQTSGSGNGPPPPGKTEHACLWNSATNTFDFSFGQMSVSLLDILAITGLPIHAKPYVPGDFASTEFTYSCNLGARRALKGSYAVWRKYYIGHAERHEGGIAFLEYWLDKFVFCGSAHKPTGKWTKLAEALYNGIEVGLGQSVLGALYRTLHTLSLKPFHLSAGPLWVLDLWMQLYFPLFQRAPLEFLSEEELLGFAVCRNSADRTPLSFFASLSILYNQLEPPPTIDMMVRRRHPEVLLAGFFPCSDSDSDAKTTFMRATSCCDLQLAEDEQGFELYAPNHFARQLGFFQGVPYPLFHSVNKYTSWRKIGETDRVTPLQNIFPLTPDLLEIEPSLGVDPAYLSWCRSLSDNNWEFPDDAVFAAIFDPLYNKLGESDRVVLDAQRERAEGSQRTLTRSRLGPPPAVPCRRSARRPEATGDKGKAPAQEELVAEHDGETAPIIPQSTNGESSRKRPAEDEEELLEEERYRQEYGLVRRRIRPRLAAIEGETGIVEVPIPEPVVEEQTAFIEEVNVLPVSPIGVASETDPSPKFTLVPARGEGFDRTNLLSDFTASLAIPPEDIQPVFESSPLQPDSVAQTIEATTDPTRSEVPPSAPESETVAEVEPTTPALMRTSGEAVSSLAIRTARLRARVTPPADPEIIRLARSFFHGLLRQGPHMNVFDLVRRAREAHGTLIRHLASSTPALDHALELIDAVELQPRRVQDAGAQSAAQEGVRQALNNHMAVLLAELEDVNVPEASSENPCIIYARQVEALETQIAELQAQLAQARQNLAQAEDTEARVQAVEETQEALDSATAAADEAQAQLDAEELALEGLLLDLYRASRRI
uniref:uncharacterized protein LOC101297108 n=1 Tax=Fragaria vesca subsp. vesca TaxID=101020 RepID=UPI0005C975E6|nr:PREDICTED: uncharacterized protein LOC101297108 [Fragaria vesca subsp. vesca]